MNGDEPLRIPFRISVSAAFILISVPLILAIIGILYVRNAQLARDLAAQAMSRAAADIVNHIDGLLSPLARVVEATSTLGRIDRGALRHADAFQYYLKVLESTPQAESLYVGFAHDGSFFQASRLPPGLKQFGPSGAKPPQGAHFALRILDASSGEMADSFIYLAKWGDIVAVERGSATFDPRQRLWYKSAWRQVGLSVSDAYVFFSSREPGITLSERIATSDGVAIGAAGADISLAALSAFMARERVGEHGISIIIDHDGRLIGYPTLDMIVRQEGSELTLAKATTIDDPLVVKAAKLRESGAGDRFTANLGNDDYLVSFTRLPESFGKDWLIGVIAAESDFVGPIRRTSWFMLGLGAILLVVSTLAILAVSQSLTRPIGRVVGETKRIRNFDLGVGFAIKSRIVEIHELARALEVMEEGLRSFGAYIPKALVRRIIASGQGTGIGGERRTLTMVFTDIKDFTRRSEALAPEDVLEQLSTYFDAISRCIHDRGGTVDKFIGDAVMAFWNAPLADPDHAGNACQAVLRCRAINAELNARFEAEGRGPMPTRFGLHTGEVVVGNVGSTDRMQYTALGAEVNLASRVEGLNKLYGTQIIATGAVEARVRDRFLFRPLDLVVPAGTSLIIPIFELVGALDDGPDGASEAEIEACAQWQQAIELYRKHNWDDARVMFQNYAEWHSADDAGRLYIERCTRFQSAPPPPTWDGAEHYDVK